MFTSLRSRLWFTYALLSGIILCVVGVGLLLYLVRNPPATAREYQRLQLIATLIVRRPNLADFNAFGNKNEILERLDGSFNARIAILNFDGTVLIDTRSEEEPSIPKLVSLAVKTGTIGKRENQRFLDSKGQVWLYVHRQIEEEGFVIVATPRPQVPLLQILREELIPPILQAGLGAVVLALLLAVWMARWVTSPLQRMTQSAQALADGKHEPTIIEGPREVQVLARSFNEMSRRVQATQQSQRDFIANVSHDLKTPLTSIQGFAQAILDGTANTPEELSQASGVIYAEAGRMHRMVQDLLELARMDAGTAEFKHQLVDLAGLIRSLVEKFTPQARQSQVDLRSELGPSITTTGDEDRLVQAFTNLVDNALKFTPAYGEVVIRAGKAAGQVEVSVSDSGPGVPLEDLPFIFDRFYQTDKSRSRERCGSGLGLSIANEIIKAHRGTISVHSPPGKGSTFTVTLPASHLEEQA